MLLVRLACAAPGTIPPGLLNIPDPELRGPMDVRDPAAPIPPRLGRIPPRPAVDMRRSRASAVPAARTATCIQAGVVVGGKPQTTRWGICTHTALVELGPQLEGLGRVARGKVLRSILAVCCRVVHPITRVEVPNF